MSRKRRKKIASDAQYVLIKAEAAYPRRWQGIRSDRPFKAQVRGTMFEPRPQIRQMDLFEDRTQLSAEGG